LTAPARRNEGCGEPAHLARRGGLASAENIDRRIHVADEGMTTTPSGLQYRDDAVGEGREAKAGDTVSVHYTGTLKDGSKFDSSRDRGQPIQFPLGTGYVIKGWDEGIAGMKVGGKRTLVIPPELGYGARGFPPEIPGNSTLLFDVELVGIR
jgi:peptidylprolyl isomerase